MSGSCSSIIFYPLAIILITFAILTIVCKNIFYSLLSAIVVFILSAVLFYVLGSEYNAIIQFAIYGIAVPIILGLCVMFSGYKKPVAKKKNKRLKYALFLTTGIFILAFVYLMLTSFVAVPDGFNVSISNNINFVNTISAFSNGIFGKYVFAFEIMALILTIAIVGLSLFKKEEKVK